MIARSHRFDGNLQKKKIHDRFVVAAIVVVYQMLSLYYVPLIHYQFHLHCPMHTYHAAATDNTIYSEFVKGKWPGKITRAFQLFARVSFRCNRWQFYGAKANATLHIPMNGRTNVKQATAAATTATRTTFAIQIIKLQ